MRFACGRRGPSLFNCASGVFLMVKMKNWRDDEGTLVPHSRNNGEALETKGAERYQCAFSRNLSDTIMNIEYIVDR